MATKKVGTPVEGEYDSYTAEQLAALEEMKDRSYVMGVAEEKYANSVLHPDGTITKDTSPILKAAQDKLKKLTSGDLEDPDTLRDAEFAARKVKEVKDHIAQKCFLFVVNEDMTRVVYFQCATKSNKHIADVRRVENDDDKAEVEESMVRMRNLIDHTHRKAASRKAAAAVGVIEP